MIDRNKLEYFTVAAWLRGYAESIESSKSYVKTPIVEKLTKAASMLEYVFNSEIEMDDKDE